MADKEMKKYVVLLDLDDTLIEYDAPKLKPEAMAAVQALHEAGHTLVLFSHNSSAWRLASRVGLGPYFAHNCSGARDHWKQWNLTRAQELTGTDKSDMILFDDDPEICAVFRKTEVRVCEVGRAGLTLMHVIRRGLLPWHPVFGYGLGHLC
jgi:hydroxymethylpyrimidine pyrophosphatase-like HAD family hydrolase